MTIKQYHIYLADLEPSFGAEPGKVRPVVAIQTDSLNTKGHHTTLVCPLTTEVRPRSVLLRVYLPAQETGLRQDSDILVDQIRAIDNRRFHKNIGKLSDKHIELLIRNLNIVLFE